MHPASKRKHLILAAFLLGTALTSCQDEPTASENAGNAKGGLALAFSARALAQMESNADSIHLRLVGGRDTVQSISRLGDTIRFDGLRVGIWSIYAQVYANDSGAREVSWVGSANANVEPGRVARVPLLLRKPTGSLVVDIDIDDGTIDTPSIIAPRRIERADSAKWRLDPTHYLVIPHHDTSGAWIRGSVMLLGAKIGPNGLVARVAVRGGGNAVDGILAPVYDHCGGSGVDTLCLPNSIQLVGRPSPRLVGHIDDSVRVVETVIGLGSLRDRQIVLLDDYANTMAMEDLSQDMSRCEILQNGKGVCYDASGSATSYLAPFDR